MSLCAKLVPSNQRDVATAMQMESLGMGQWAGNSRVPRGILGASDLPGQGPVSGPVAISVSVCRAA